MWKNYLLITGISLISIQSFYAQEEDPSCLAPSKKAQKYIFAGQNAGDPKTAAENFAKAIEEAPDNAGAYFEFGMYAYESGKKAYETVANPAQGDRSWVKAEQLLVKAAELCPDYHSDIFYYLGVINYTQDQKEEANKWFQKFVDFKNTDNSRYGTNYAKQLTDVKKLLVNQKEDSEMASKQVPFNPKKVQNVSTGNDEYFPMISPDNLLMFYTRKQDVKNLGDLVSNVQEVYTYSNHMDEGISFDGGKAFPKPFNNGSFQSYGGATMSVDNKEMIICACKRAEVNGQAYMNCDLYSTTYQKTGPNPSDYQWSELVNLGPKINTPDGWEAQPSMSADGNTLFYTANRRTTKDNDVFVVKRNPDGTWGSPRPFDEINTAGKDKSPFLHQDSETLYFVSTVSDDRKGAGGLDIFYMREENGVWSKPKNIGYPINTAEDEIGIFVSTDGKLAYYSSQQQGNWDIYGFDLYEEARPKAVTIIKGDLKDPTGKPIENAIIEVAYESSDKVEQVRVNGNDGKYAVVVKTEKPQDIMVSVKKDGAAFDSKLITKEEIVKKENRVNNNLEVKELKVGEAYTINDILYDYNSDFLSTKSKFILREFARFLKSNPTVKIMVQGHTDSDGDDAKNLDLSDRRAKGVKAYLQSQGIESDRLEAKGYGETKPKVENDTPENKAKNRRTDFLIQGM
ncbi:OmpA family protein [Fluviicola taffensis]|uniref:OmpA/MotB domain protein n=1 Tax=Fluviicola taffensis (strain DSM 16823 / NCIMB 13979 / RW262) TaxID=755732 RepID=F2IKF8_FLUTR|nr:OmpA family protein [Fluviicola taffensis]AEA45084.1 OmpA/MotB domain protein [Fluviicola taffensis DSM 16823]